MYLYAYLHGDWLACDTGYVHRIVYELIEWTATTANKLQDKENQEDRETQRERRQDQREGADNRRKYTHTTQH